ncbi:MAG: serine/threonine protein kinase [Planctomycetaceae bacterium]
MKFLQKLFERGPRIEKVDISKRFDLIGRVGQGSMSKVWRATDRITGRMVAVKVLDRAKTIRFQRRFVGLNKPTEGEVAVTLRHPHIVRTLEHGVTIKDEQYLVMEFVEGRGLGYFVDVQNETMRENRLSFAIQLGDALTYLHSQNWIHRDICPRNVIVDNELNIKLIDFGLVVPNTEPFRAPGNRTGTTDYMAPELIMRQPTDPRIDVFSYAVSCYEMFAKVLPWPASDTFESALQHVNNPPKPLKVYVPDIDREVSEIIMKGLERFPDNRWQTAGEMVAALRQAVRRVELSDAGQE